MADNIAVILTDDRVGCLAEDSIVENLAGSIVNNLFCIDVFNESRHKFKNNRYYLSNKRLNTTKVKFLGKCASIICSPLFKVANVVCTLVDDKGKYMPLVPTAEYGKRTTFGCTIYNDIS